MNLPKTYLFAFLLFAASYSTGVIAQPYFDVAGISMWHMPANLNGDGIAETEGIIFVSVPVDVFQGSKLILSPFYEQRILEVKDGSASVNLKSLSLPVAWLYGPADSSWTVLAFAAFRSNSTQFRFSEDVFQIAGAVLGSYKVNPTLTLKAGVYLSGEFYGDFFMILAGVEWKISDRLHLFGLINNNLRLEYRFRENFYGGFAFKSINTSYRENGDGGYYKISDNHLGIYADISLGKKLVWNAEAGHTIFRYVKGRNGAGFPEVSRDGLVFKTGIAYRIRLY